MFLDRRRFAVAVIGWALCVFLALVIADLMILDLYFVVSLVGILIITELTAPASVSLEWRRRLQPPLVLGLLGLVYVLLSRALTVLPPDAFQQLLGG